MTESLFLLTTVSALYHIRRHRWLAAGAWGFLAALTRMQGVLVILAGVVELVETDSRLPGRRRNGNSAYGDS